jgi:hypothetical protein
MDTEYPVAYTDTYTQKVSKGKEVSALMDTEYPIAYTDTFKHAMVQRAEYKLQGLVRSIRLSTYRARTYNMKMGLRELVTVD